MKTNPNTPPRMSLSDTQTLLVEIYGKGVITDFDINSVEKYEVFMNGEKIERIIAHYKKILVKHEGNKDIYWPIQIHQEEVNKEYHINFLKKISEKT